MMVLGTSNASGRMGESWDLGLVLGGERIWISYGDSPCLLK